MSSEATTQIIGTGYVTTLQGLCKIAEVIFSFIAVLLVGIDFFGWVVELFESAAAISIIVASILLILYVTGAVAKIGLQWNKFQFFLHIILAIYYLIATALVFHHGKGWDRIIAGGVFGIFAIIAHLVDTYDNFRKF